VTSVEDASCASYDATVPPRKYPDTPNSQTQLQQIRSIERRVAATAAADLPPLLLKLGRAKAAFMPAQRSPEARYVTTHPSEFFFNEPAGAWIYKGTDFRELIRRFPTSDLADDAAYEISLLPRGGECEGSVACEIEWDWDPASKFLSEYSQSALAPSAVDRALASFSVLGIDKDLRVEPWDSPDAIRTLVESFEEVGRQLPSPVNVLQNACPAFHCNGSCWILCEWSIRILWN
jgi:hypothetical protein